ncbi:MAG: hypothetical protein R2798_10590 [Chitinophagales bacterium]|nr:hypothetical protein [Bacteroidota bacterium]MCB9043996.1 hypothetical protein [Chitinophagales bacterium]
MNTPLTLENFENNCIAYWENLMTKAEKQSFLAWLEQHPSLKNDWQMFGEIYLQADESVKMPQKHLLLKPETSATKVVSMAWYQNKYFWRGAAAACVVFFFAFQLMRFYNMPNEIVSVENESTPLSSPTEIEKPEQQSETTFATQTAASQNNIAATSPAKANLPVPDTHKVNIAPKQVASNNFSENKTNIQSSIAASQVVENEVFIHKKTTALQAKATRPKNIALFATLPTQNATKLSETSATLLANNIAPIPTTKQMNTAHKSKTKEAEILTEIGSFLASTVGDEVLPENIYHKIPNKYTQNSYTLSLNYPTDILPKFFQKHKN